MNRFLQIQEKPCTCTSGSEVLYFTGGWCVLLNAQSMSRVESPSLFWSSAWLKTQSVIFLIELSWPLSCGGGCKCEQVQCNLITKNMQPTPAPADTCNRGCSPFDLSSSVEGWSYHLQTPPTTPLPCGTCYQAPRCYCPAELQSFINQCFD